jgi:hypothetical protein
MTIIWAETTKCEHGVQGQCLECLLLVEERLEEQETICHHAGRLPNGECDECEDNSVREYWRHRRDGGFYIE